MSSVSTISGYATQLRDAGNYVYANYLYDHAWHVLMRLRKNSHARARKDQDWEEMNLMSESSLLHFFYRDFRYAESCVKRSILIARQLLDARDRRYLACADHQGLYFFHLKEMTRAIESSASMLEEWGPTSEDPLALHSRHFDAQVCFYKGDKDNAIKRSDEVKRSRNRSDVSRLDYAQSLHTSGKFKFYVARDKRGEEQRLLREGALADLEEARVIRIDEHAHPSGMHTLRRQYELYKWLGKKTEADRCKSECEEIQKRTFGANVLTTRPLAQFEDEPENVW